MNEVILVPPYVGYTCPSANQLLFSNLRLWSKVVNVLLVFLLNLFVRRREVVRWVVRKCQAYVTRQ